MIQSTCVLWGEEKQGRPICGTGAGRSSNPCLAGSFHRHRHHRRRPRHRRARRRRMRRRRHPCHRRRPMHRDNPHRERDRARAFLEIIGAHGHGGVSRNGWCASDSQTVRHTDGVSPFQDKYTRISRVGHTKITMQQTQYRQNTVPSPQFPISMLMHMRAGDGTGVHVVFCSTVASLRCRM